MIRYSLRCNSGHVFDSWFANAAAYDRLETAGQLTCAVCASTKVGKALMVPQLNAKAVDAAPQPSPSPETAPAAQRTLEAALTELRRKVEDSSEYVGRDFVKEARRIHAGEAPERAIYGEARPDEARRLAADGIAVLPLPFRAKSQLN